MFGAPVILTILGIDFLGAKFRRVFLSLQNIVLSAQARFVSLQLNELMRVKQTSTLPRRTTLCELEIRTSPR
jgi:hypothetical protein